MSRWLLLTCLFIGCAESVPFERFCDEAARADCLAQQRCGAVSAAIDCAKQKPASAVACSAILKPVITNGTLQYDGAAAKKCLDASKTTACLGLQAPPALSSDTSCQQVLTGEQTEGEACGFCESGLSCSYASGQLCGTCVKSRVDIADGEGCSPGTFNGCARNSYCSNSVCTPRVTEGNACTSGSCALGLLCKGEVCVRPGDVGVVCSAGECLSGLFCSSGTCALTKPNGESCSTSTDCESQRCGGGVCVGPRAEGESCEGGCDNGLYCDSGSCVRGKATGEACAIGQCATGSCFEGACHDTLLECRA